MHRDQILARYRAPWGTTLTVITTGTVVLLVGIAIAGLLFRDTPDLQPQPLQLIWLLSMVGLPLGILLGSALFQVQGYVLTREHLYIQRWGWQTQVPLATLLSGEADPQAMDHSLRLWGNGGLFAIVGHFRNGKLGHYRAYATDLKRCVVIKLTDRTLVITPDQPADFVAQLNLLAQS